MIPERSAVAGPRRTRQLPLVEDVARPIVKWAGGKTQLLPEIRAALPPGWSSSGRRYFEPFAGGAALLFDLSPLRAVVSDVNKDLVDLYQEVVVDAPGLHRRTSILLDCHARAGEGFYYEQRALWNGDRGSWSRADRASTFLYLNKACFNGLWRVNRSGLMNSPCGRSSSGQPPGCPSLAHLVAAGAVLSRCEILQSHYLTAVEGARSGDLVYFDPPYLARSRSASFSTYASGGFLVKDHDVLGRCAVDLVSRGVLVLVSSSDVPGARDLYPGFSAREVTAKRAISARTRGRARVGELLLAGGYHPATWGVA